MKRAVGTFGHVGFDPEGLEEWLLSLRPHLFSGHAQAGEVVAKAWLGRTGLKETPGWDS